MKSFLDFAKEKENEELKRQVDHLKNMSDEHDEKAESALMMGDRDGHALHMAKCNHFKAQHETLKSKLNEKVEQIDEKSAAWQRKEGKSESGGLNKKGIASYRRENPGSKLSMAVTTKPSKLKPGSKSANRRKSFCARMSGMKKRLTSAKTANDPNSRINKSLRKWNC
jgi:hypothetical protein